MLKIIAIDFFVWAITFFNLFLKLDLLTWEGHTNVVD
jgi:hypothetical protein